MRRQSLPGGDRGDRRAAMNGRRLGDDAAFDVTDDERARVQAVLAE
ncbi:MAG: hypothetical protein M3Q71_02585 [Chloroflexota bacterium]|nr:hypothetical protein [Chloroflexota bacterium]